MTMHIMIHGRAGSTVAPAWGRSHVKQLKRPQPCGESRMQNMTKSTAGKVRATDSRDRVQLFVQYQPHREPARDASGAAASVIVQTLIGHTAETVQTRAGHCLLSNTTYTPPGAAGNASATLSLQGVHSTEAGQGQGTVGQGQGITACSV